MELKEELIIACRRRVESELVTGGVNGIANNIAMLQCQETWPSQTVVCRKNKDDVTDFSILSGFLSSHKVLMLLSGDRYLRNFTGMCLFTILISFCALEASSLA